MKVRSKNGLRVQSGLALLALTLTAMTLTSSAIAQREHRVGPSHWRGDISRFHEHDWNTWRGGHWTHGRHDGRLGWWWVAGGLWYLYPAPVYPYPNPWQPPPVALATPPVNVVPPVPPTQYWYFCEASRAYYPYVPACPAGWKEVPATPDSASSIPRQ